MDNDGTVLRVFVNEYSYGMYLRRSNGGEGNGRVLPTRAEQWGYLAIRRQCASAAAIKFSLASGVRNAECADSVTFGSFVNG